MHLWQIRHIPNRPQTLLKLTIVAMSFAFAVVTLVPPIGFVAGQTGDGGTDTSGTETKPSAAAEFLERVRQELPKHRSIKADLLQSVSIGDQQFKVRGQYLSLANDSAGSQPSSDGNSAINKLRLSYVVIPDQGVRGEMLEVCDGKELWTELTLPDSKRVTRRNIQQILAAAMAANHQGNVSQSSISIELGLGGLTALLASLEKSMTFHAIKEDQVDGRSRTIIQGRWKKEISARFPKEKDDMLPPFVPDLVWLYVDSQTLFPEKLLYLKKQPQKKAFKSLVSLEFTNVEFDGPVDETEFVYNLPEGITPEEVTRQYVDRLTAPAADPLKAAK